MSSSGTYSFQLSRDDLIKSALRGTGRFGDQAAIPPAAISDCAQALNILVKEMVTKGLPLWCVVDLAIPTVANQASYNISTAAGMPIPPRVLDTYATKAQGGSTNHILLQSRYDYNQLGAKKSFGTPNEAYYDPQLSGGILTLYPIPFDNSLTLHVVIQRQIQDFNLATDNPDFPAEAFRMLKWALLDEIALEFEVPQSKRLEINQKAASIKESFFNFQQEQVSVYFAPSGRVR